LEPTVPGAPLAQRYDGGVDLIGTFGAIQIEQLIQYTTLAPQQLEFRARAVQQRQDVRASQARISKAQQFARRRSSHLDEGLHLTDCTEVVFIGLTKLRTNGSHPSCSRSGARHGRPSLRTPPPPFPPHSS